MLPTLRIADLLQRVDRDLYGGYVILDSPAAARGGPGRGHAGLAARPAAFTALRNLLYGIEWWIFGGFAVFLWWRWCRDEVRERLARGGTSALGDGREAARLPSTP